MTPKQIALCFAFLLLGVGIGTLQTIYLLRQDTPKTIMLPIPVKEYIMVTPTPTPVATRSAAVKPLLEKYIYPTP